MDKNIEIWLKKHLEEWIAIPSVEDLDSKSVEMPFGKHVFESLNWIENLAINDGFKVKSKSGKYVIIDYGNSEEYIGMFGHCDVVEAKDRWTTNPYELTERDQSWFGRGVIDDKGPVLASYLALKMIKDENIKLPYKLRLFVGGNEESGFECIKEYCKVERQPIQGIVVDAKFPVLYGERGSMKLVFEWKDSKIQGEIDVSGPSNVIANKVIWKNKNSENIFIGRGGHASKSELLLNPIIELGEWLNQFEWGKTFSQLINKKNLDTWIGSINGTGKCGDLTIEPTILKVKKGQVYLEYDLRYPETIELDFMEEKIKQLDDILDIDFKYDLKILKKANFVDPNSYLVQSLWDIYKEETGDYNSEIRVTSGGTYASELENTVIFGGEMPRNKMSGVHSFDENILKEDLVKSVDIYKAALLKLSYNKDKE